MTTTKIKTIRKYSVLIAFILYVVNRIFAPNYIFAGDVNMIPLSPTTHMILNAEIAIYIIILIALATFIVSQLVLLIRGDE